MGINAGIPRISFSPEECTGCKICEVFCSAVHSKAINPKRALINIKATKLGTFEANVCRQCQPRPPPCANACPADAFYVNDAEVYAVDSSKCTGCGLCVEACPYGAIWLDPVTNTALKCDLCNGDPQCVQICPKKVLSEVK